MRKITSLLMLFCAFVCTAWAEPTDFPEMSTEGNIKWYTLTNTRSASGQYMYWTESGVKDSNVTSAASCFYFTGSADSCYIHNYSTELLLSGAGAWTAEGVACKLSVSPLGTGFMIGFNGTFLNEQNSANGYTTWTDVNDDGSVFTVAEVTDFASVIDVPGAKAAAIAELENYAVVSSIYPDVTSTVTAINAVEPADNSIAGLDAAVEAINAKVVDYKNTAYKALEGKYFSIQTLTTERTKGFMEMAASNVVGTETLSSPAGLWQFVCNNDGTLKVFNPYTGKYLCEPQGSSSEVAVTTDANGAGNYTLAVNNTNPAVADAKIKFTSNGKSVHMAGGATLVRWDNGGASEWQVKEVTNFAEVINAYKAKIITTLDEWSQLSVVFDAALIANAKAKVGAIATTNWETFAAVDAELTNVTDAVAAKMFTFQTLATDNHREGVWVSANPATGKAIGLHGEHNYNSIWSLRHAGGVSFYMFNELNQVYMGNPGGNCVLSAEPTAAYTFEIIDAENGVVEMKCGGETMHASNHADDKLLNWDGDEEASRWYIRTIDVASDIQAILDELTAEDYAEVPALGQYPTAAYEALVAARTNAKTVEAVNAAIAAFNKSKNLPVFTISGTKDYVLGKSIYDNNSGSLYFKATNNYDKSMWWAFDQTETTVGVTDKVVVTNVATGNKFWGANSVKITETSDSIVDDGIFLLYTEGNGTPVHYQNDNQVIVRWNSTDAASGSAMTFTYVGNTYDIEKLTGAHIEALRFLQTNVTTYAKYLNAEVGTALGQYAAGDKEAVLAAFADAQAIAAMSVTEVTQLSPSDINGVSEAIYNSSATFFDFLNMPKTGFYRVKSMNGNDENKKGKYWQSNAAGTGMELAAEKNDVRSVIYLDSLNNVISYGSGFALNSYSDFNDIEPKAWTIAENAKVAGAYALFRNGDAYCLSDWTGGVTYGQNDANAAWALEEVTALPVSIADTLGYATLYAPVALTIPAEVTAYTGYVEGDVLKLTAIEWGIIPAKTAVLIQAAAGTYNFEIIEDDVVLEGDAVAVIKGNDLIGISVGEASVEGVFTLQNIGGVVGFHKYTAENLHGFKAFLIPETAQTVKLGFAGTTAIENITTAFDVNAPIYDLAGRRVNAATKGIFIQNGKKIIVK